MDWEMFFVVHDGLLRQGPGTAEDVSWAVALADLPPDSRICDAACGQGADLEALHAAAPTARIVAVDKRPTFVANAAAQSSAHPQILCVEGDLAALPDAPHDMIWCAGALYFLGLSDGLQTMRAALAPGGVLAFSEPCFFTDSPSAEARAFWEGYPTQTVTAISQEVENAGFSLLGQRLVTDAGWAAYYDPMAVRIADLRPEADDRLRPILDMCAQEADRWQAVKSETGYVLTVARVT